MRVPMHQIDTFTTRRFAGNPTAVPVADGEDFRLRGFTPTVAVPLRGHATLASAAFVMALI